MKRKLSDVIRDYREYINCIQIPTKNHGINILGIGVSELKESLIKDGFRGLVLTTLNVNVAQEILKTGKIDLLVYDVSGGDDSRIRDSLEEQKTVGRNIYVAKTLGCVPRLNKREVYEFLTD
ncbi:unnamed protein product [marine sediment metagenome]|uniref:Uncharacterized protein n=1 Tax=marine sediment metagenome TaxID=412755 RepID=X1LIZ2_9ZZZZ